MKQLVAALVGLVAAAVSVGLGSWQLSRLAERRAQNARVEASLAKPPLDLAAGSVGPAFAYRRAVAHGVFDFTRQIVLMVRSRRGVPGVHVVTPLRLADGTAVLVERGFVASPDGRRVDLAAVSEPDTAAVSGLLLQVIVQEPAPSDASWPVYLVRADPTRLQSMYAYPLRPYLLRRTTASPEQAATLHALDPPARTDGSHLSYAIQWFSFAVIAVLGTATLIAKSRRDTIAAEG